MSEPKRTIGNSNTPFSYRTNPEWETWAIKRIEELEAELNSRPTAAQQLADAMKMRKEYADLEAENKRLLDTLKSIAKCEPNWEPIHIAEKALRGVNDEQG